MDLINPITEAVAKDLNLTYQEMLNLEKILFKMVKDQKREGEVIIIKVHKAIQL